MRTNLNEEIQRNLKLMGILNEAASPSKGIFKLLFSSLVGNALDTAIAKIELKTGKKFAGKGIKSFEDAITSGGITRKEATKFIVEALIANGKSIDEIATEVTSKTPNFLEAVRRASKSGVDKAEVKAAVPELAELSDNLVDAILKKGGYEAIGNTLQDTNKLVADFVTTHPELFEKLPWFKKGDYKNAGKIKAIQDEINKKFAGKNRTAIQAELKQIFDDANDVIKKSKLTEPEKKAWYAVLGKSAAETAAAILKAPISRDQATGEVRIIWTGLKYIGAVFIAKYLTEFTYNVFATDSVAGAIAATGKSEIDAVKKVLQGEPTYEYSPAGFIEFLNKTEGKNDYGNKDLFTIYVDTATGILEITGNTDKITKKYKYLEDKKTYEKIN